MFKPFGVLSGVFGYLTPEQKWLNFKMLDPVQISLKEFTGCVWTLIRTGGQNHAFF